MKLVKTPEVLEARQAWLAEQKRIDDKIEAEKRMNAEQLMSPEAVVNALVRALQIQYQASGKDILAVDVLAVPEAFPEEDLTIARHGQEVHGDKWGDYWFNLRIQEADKKARESIRQSLSQIFANDYSHDFKHVSFDSRVERNRTPDLSSSEQEVSQPTHIRALMYVDDVPF